MAALELKDLEGQVESYHYTDVCEEEVENLNHAIDEALQAINQSILAVRRLIVVRDVMRGSEHNKK